MPPVPAIPPSWVVWGWPAASPHWHWLLVLASSAAEDRPQRVESANDSQPYLFRSFQTIFLNFKTLKITTFPTNENETVIQVIKTAKNRDFHADKIFKTLKIVTKIKEKTFRNYGEYSKLTTLASDKQKI